jgi:hypothetical protein
LILEGVLRPDEALAAERELADKLEVSRPHLAIAEAILKSDPKLAVERRWLGDGPDGDPARPQKSCRRQGTFVRHTRWRLRNVAKRRRGKPSMTKSAPYSRPSRAVQFA